MFNSTALPGVPPLPSYSLSPLPPLLPPIPDKFLTLILPVVAYWALSLFFHFLDVNDYLPQYRLHTPVELVRRNHVSKKDVIRDVFIQQIIQTVIGVLLGMTEPEDVFGKEDYDVAVWATRIRMAQRVVPGILSVVGLNATGMAKNVAGSYPVLSGFLSGGNYPWLTHAISLSSGDVAIVPAFATWEVLAAKATYWVLVPALQFSLAVFFMDTWQYFLHRAMHSNLWLYRTFHSRHHRLYVPYAFGALYNHPFEGFLLDTMGASIAFKLAGLTTRQGMWFFTCSTIKTVDDHCGYALPWDPLQHLTGNNAAYHDIHHQSWGIKTNFSQPFFTFWDRILGTTWTAGDVSARYERSRKSAQHAANGGMSGTPTTDEQSRQAEHASAKALPAELKVNLRPLISASRQAVELREQDGENGGPRILADETEEEKEPRIAPRRSPRKKGGNATPSDVGSLKGLRERVNGSLHGRSGGVLGLESSR
ncbi:hypothetical protein GP486_008178 [Trichoglossum hirsutum]|uniref:Fatty acid hydroxylase domain-containing protein n=1 Tax=Trichoglossum hirsutum TaxID=265104 RepID=A0A9P8IGG4_9PEZI|nr:hypothetical protein GP486_008178 [Trichoglossum hirsutum]